MGKERVDYILKAEYLLTMTDAEKPVTDGAVAVKGCHIVDAGKREEIEERYEAPIILGGAKKAILPGLINTHTHAPMVYFRGMADDLPLNVWLHEHIWPAEAKWLGPEFVRDATGLACLEMLRAGVTLYNDMYFFEDSAAEAIMQTGMRAVLGAGILDFPSSAATTTDEYLEKAEDFIRRWLGNDLITPSIAPHAPYTCSPETYRRAIEIGCRYKVPIHTHLSETRWEVEEIERRYRRRPVEHLNEHGLLNERMLAAHCVWLTEREIEILAERGVSISHCLESNLKLASGIAPIVRMLKAGVRVSLGTDGAASNNDLDILSEMSTAAKLHKAVSEDPTALSARTALLMATRRGAEALGLGDRLGSLQKGMLADIIIIDMNRPHLTPIYDIYSHIVYSAKASDVETVMVNGRPVINNCKLLTCSEEDIIKKACEWREKIALNS